MNDDENPAVTPLTSPQQKRPLTKLEVLQKTIEWILPQLTQEQRDGWELLEKAAQQAAPKPFMSTHKHAERAPEGNVLSAEIKRAQTVRDGAYLFHCDATGRITIEQRGRIIERPSTGLYRRATDALDRAQRKPRQSRGEPLPIRRSPEDFLPNELDPDRPLLEQLEERAANGDEQTREMLEKEFYPNPEIMSLSHDSRIVEPDHRQVQSSPEQRDVKPAQPQREGQAEQPQTISQPADLEQMLAWAAQMVAIVAQQRNVAANLALVEELLAPHHDAQSGKHYGLIAERAAGKLRYEHEAARNRGLCTAPLHSGTSTQEDHDLSTNTSQAPQNPPVNKNAPLGFKPIPWCTQLGDFKMNTSRKVIVLTAALAIAVACLYVPWRMPHVFHSFFGGYNWIWRGGIELRTDNAPSYYGAVDTPMVGAEIAAILALAAGLYFAVGIHKRKLPR